MVVVAVEWEVRWCIVEADAEQHLSRRRSQLSLQVGLTFAGLMEEWDSDRVQSAGASVRAPPPLCRFSLIARAVRAVCTRRRQDHRTWESTTTPSRLVWLV